MSASSVTFPDMKSISPPASRRIFCAVSETVGAVTSTSGGSMSFQTTIELMSNAKEPLLREATRDLASFGARLRYEDIPDAVVERIKSSVLDSLGCCIFGATLPWTRKVAELADAEGAAPAAWFMGMGRGSSVALAVLVNS